MVSRRNFITITLMMIVLFCMFQVPQIVKDQINDYGTNDKIHEVDLNNKNVWESVGEEHLEGEYNLFVGNAESAIGNAIAQWGTYRKEEFVICDALQKFEKKNKEAPTMILVESEYLDLDQDVAELKAFADKGTMVVFCDLPSYEVIKKHSDLKELLGIRGLKQSSVSVEGYHLYEGFLLGGETIYKVDKKEDADRQDMCLELPWYTLGTGTEVYMTGILQESFLKENDLDREFWPATIWSHAQGKGKVFAVNGNYMTESMGLGLLSAMVYSAKEYDVYPVIDAQILTVANYPGFADENQEYMNEIYNSTISQLCRDTIYPELLAVADQSGFALTCMIQPQYDYSDKNEPRKDELEFYLKLFKEKEFEAGLSLDYKKDTNLADKLQKDEAYLDLADNTYDFAVAYTVKEKLPEILKEKTLPAFKTIVCLDSQMQTLVDYCSKETLLLSVTDDACEHTFTDDLRLKSLETALGYSNVLLDMNRVFWAESDEKSWEELSIDFSSHLNTYWKPFQIFSDTTVSEADQKVREFLNLDYTYNREGNTISIDVENLGETSSFVFRTHGEKIAEIDGASYEKLEEDAYLIRAEEAKIVIEVEKDSLMN